MRALELMKTHVQKIAPDGSLREALDLMDLYQVGGLPVVDADGRLCGMITERDVARALWGDGPETLEALDCLEATARTVGACMSQPVVSVEEQCDLATAARLMLDRKLKRLPVVSAEGRVIGVLNRIDVLQAILEGSV